MISIPTVKNLAAAALVAGACFVPVTPAHAIVVGGNFDPVYGSPFQGTDGSMFWYGTADFHIKDSCVLTGTGLVTSQPGSCGAGNMFVDNAKVYLSTAALGTPFATLTFTGSAEIFVASFVGGQLASVTSDYFMPWAIPTVVTNTFNVAGFTFNLGFDYDGAMLFHSSNSGIPHHLHGHDDTEQFWNGNGYGHLAKPCSITLTTEDTDFCGHGNTAATVTFDRIALNVPEPQTHALLLLGLGAVGVAARRRKGTSS